MNASPSPQDSLQWERLLNPHRIYPCLLRESCSKSVARSIFLFCLILFLHSCANPVAPTGGEPDKTPPQIIASEPIQRAINVHPTSISLLFNTFIAQRDKLYQSLTLTPPVKTEYTWFGKQLFINIREPLDSNITVLLTLGTDYTNWDGNKPESAYTLVFATGGKLDSGMIRGSLDRSNNAPGTGQNERISAFLYPLSGIKPDTLNPGKTPPKYKLPIGSKGTFEFPALARGLYRLFLVNDEFRNDVIDVGTDAFGTTTQDIDLPEGSAVEVKVRLSPKTDALPPNAFEVRQVSARRLLLRWSEKVEALSIQASEWILEDSANKISPVSIPQIEYLHADANNASTAILYLTNPFDNSLFTASTRLRLRLNAVRDSAGNSVPDSLRSTYFSPNLTASQQDTTPPLLLRTVLLNVPEAERFSANAPVLADSMRGVPLLPRIAFVFSSALRLNFIERDASSGQGLKGNLRQETAKDIVWENAKQLPVPFQILPSTQANMMIIEPRMPLQANDWYSLGFRTNLLQAWNNVPLKDSVVIVRFQTTDPRDYGAVSGTLLDSARVLPAKVSTIRLNASNDGVLTTQANISRSSTSPTIKIKPRFIPSTKGQYIVILEATQNLVSESNSKQNAPKQTPNGGLQGSSNQASGSQTSTAFAPKRFQRVLRFTKEDTPMIWSFSDIPPANYTLSVFYDANGNGLYDYGQVFPYAPAERYHVHPREIQVRARWTIENVQIIFP